MPDFTDTKPIGLYEAAIGEKNQDYYLEKFEAFDQLEPGLHASWNWGAFLFGGLWAFYRKMYGWGSAWWLLVIATSIFQKVPNAGMQLGLTALLILVWLIFSVFANSLYHAKIKSRSEAVAKSTSDASKVDRWLRAKNGVNGWVPVVFGAVPVIGTVLAVALPA